VSAQDAIAFLGAFGVFFGVLGTAGKWLLGHIAANTLASEVREQGARAELSGRLRQEIDELRLELAKVLAEKSLYLKRIYQLEYFIYNQKGIEIPVMKDWPPA